MRIVLAAWYLRDFSLGMDGTAVDDAATGRAGRLRGGHWGEQHDVREFTEAAFARVGLDYRNHVTINPQLIRPAEGELLLSDASKARQKLGWSCQVKSKELVEEMVEADLRVCAKLR